MHDTLFVFDIETIPDTQAVKALTGCDSEDVQELRQALTDYHLTITDGKNSFPRQPFHQVVAISFVEATIDYTQGGEAYHLKAVRSGGTVESSEEELLRGFFHYLSKSRPRLVSFNGRTFDLPVLKYRAMKYGIAAPWLYQRGDKWNNYGQRYSIDWHCDLLDVISDFGASARVKLDEVCSILGIPGKFGVDGSQVSAMVDTGRLQDVRDYCETDVLNTYLVYLRVMQHRGVLEEKDYQHAIEQLHVYLQQDAVQRPHLLAFADAWAEAEKALMRG